MSQKVKKIVVKKILEQLEKGEVPWKKPWFNRGKGNLESGHVYQGINKIMLADNPDSFYLTFNQVKKLNGKVNKGAKSEIVVFWKINSYPKLDKNGKPVKNDKGEEETKTVPILRYYKVFGLSQVTLPKEVQDKLTKKHEAKLKENKIDMNIEKFVKKTKAKIEYYDKDRVFYSPGNDLINMPEIMQFDNSPKYYNTLFHELGHWTGHKKRCDRDLKNFFGSEEYGKEELIAELINCMLSHDFEIADYKQSSAYIASWKKAIKDNNNIIFSSSTKAEEGYKFLRELVKTKARKKSA